MKQRPVRKLLALVLSLLLVLAFTPAAFAEEPVVAKIGDVEYKTVQEAVKAIEEFETKSGTIEMVANSTEDVTIPKDVTITLNIAENVTLTNKSDHTITNNGTLTIAGNGTVDNVSHAKGALVNNGTVVLESGLLTRSAEAGESPSSSGGNSWYVVDNATNATMTVTGGTVKATGHFSSLLRNNGMLNIQGGLFENNFIAIKNEENGTVNMTDGTVYAHDPGASAIQNWGQATVKGGTLTGGVAIYALSYSDIDSSITVSGDANFTGKVIAQFYGKEGETSKPTINIESGIINGDIEVRTQAIVNITGGSVTGSLNKAEDPNNELNVSGGVFDNQPAEEYIGDSLMAQVDGDGKYYIGSAANTAIAGADDSVTVLNGSSVSGVPTGVTVKNETGLPITVNGDSLGAGSSTTIKGNFTEPEYYPDYDEDVDYLPPVEDEEEEEEAPLYMVTCRTLNVRMGPGTSYAKLGTLSRGTIISGEYENGWVKFTYNGQTAYSSADYLMQVDGDLSGLHVTCRTLNVRAGAGTNFDILGTLSRGTEISVRDVLPGWYEIDFLGGIGYVSSAYIG